MIALVAALIALIVLILVSLWLIPKWLEAVDRRQPKVAGSVPCQAGWPDTGPGRLSQARRAKDPAT